MIALAVQTVEIYDVGAKYRKKRKTGAEIAAELLAARVRDFSAVGLSPSQAALSANDDVTVDRASMENVERARRLDAFEALKPSMDGKEYVGAYDAARRFERDMAIRLDESDHGAGLDRVDNGRESALSARLLKRIDAGETIDAVLKRVCATDRALLTLLTDPPRGRFDHWRQIVAFVTGERNGNAQGAVVRYACVNLRDAYEDHDREAKTAKKAKAAEMAPG